MRTSVGKLGPGLDTRYEGGYVVAPGSLHQNGSSYISVDPEAPVSAIPEWMSDELGGPKRSPRPRRLKDKRSMSEGERNDGLFREACSLRGRGRAEAQISEALLAINEVRCEPPLGPDEVKRIVRSAASYPAGANLSRADTRNQFWWYPLNVNTLCTDIRMTLLNDYQSGWLFWLRVYAWTLKGYLPNDPAALARLARSSDPERFLAEIHVLMAFFHVTEDESQIFDPELVDYWTEKAALAEANSKAGKASAAKRRKPSAERIQIPTEEK